MSADATAGTPRTILLADDAADIRSLLRMILEFTGPFTIVAEATNGAEAVDLAERHHPDLVLLDLAMPVMDGLEALPQILLRSPTSKIAILSGFSADRLAEQALALGAHLYLEKGLSPRDIIAKLEAVLRSALRSSDPPADD